MKIYAGHEDLPHVYVTHHITDGNGGYSGLGWAEWGPPEELIHLPPRACPHEAEDRKTCRHIECKAWRLAVIEWATNREKADT